MSVRISILVNVRNKKKKKTTLAHSASVSLLLAHYLHALLLPQFSCLRTLASSSEGPIPIAALSEKNRLFLLQAPLVFFILGPIMGQVDMGVWA